jgi:hypothetical protein
MYCRVKKVDENPPLRNVASVANWLGAINPRSNAGKLASKPCLSGEVGQGR